MTKYSRHETIQPEPNTTINHTMLKPNHLTYTTTNVTTPKFKNKPKIKFKNKQKFKLAKEDVHQFCQNLDLRNQ